MGRWLLGMLLTATMAASAWAQTPNPAATSPTAGDSRNPPAEKAAPDDTQTQRSRQSKPRASDPSAAVSLAERFFDDQKAIWSSPARIREPDGLWLAPMLGLGAALLATDSTVSRHLSNSTGRLNRSSEISNAGVGALIGAAGGMYLWGEWTQKAHWQETGFLSLESLADSLVVNNAINFAVGRERPQVDNYRGRFWTNGRSFPSNHSVAAWSVASVIAHEYPGTMTRLLAYGLAAAVSGSRITAKQHFPSDVFAGAAIGWLVGEHVYRAHHNPELGGEAWNTFAEQFDEAARDPANFGSPYVPLDSWVYRAFERLAAMGYVHSEMLGLRPWTRLECARLLGEAQDRINADGGDPPAGVGSLVDALEREFHADLDLLSGGSNRSAELESVYARTTGISGQPLTDGFHFGQTIINDDGRPYEEGANAGAGFTGWGSYGPLVAYVNGEYQHAPSAPPLPLAARQFISRADILPPMPALSTPAVDRFDLVNGYVGLTFENWEISAGKQSVWWGPGAGGSLIYSDNAEPLDMVRLTRVTPFRLPSILGLLGPITLDFWVGRQHGANFIDTPAGLVGHWGGTLNPQPIIEGQKMSFKPTPNLEFGFDRTTIYGGPGFPLTTHTFLRSLFSTANENAGAATKPGDRQAGFDMTYRLPGVRDWATFYVESFVDDEFIPVAYFDRAANSAGLYLPRLPKLPQFELRLEGVYSDNPISASTSGNLCCGFYYSNGTWRYGQRNAGNLFTDWVGRDGQGAQAWLTWWHSPQDFLQFQFRHQKVSHQFVPFGGTLTDAGVNAGWWPRRDLSLSAAVQYERWEFPILKPGPQTDVTASVEVAFWPRWRIH